MAVGGDSVAWRENAFCSPLASAEVVRLGSPPNPLALLPGVTSPPAVGATWDPVVDHSTFFPGAAFDVLGVSATALNVPTPIGTLLCAAPAPGLMFVRPAGVPFAVSVPWNCGLVAAQLSSQAVSLNAAFALSLTNALDISIGTF